MTAPRLVLWDIDHTLVEVADVGRSLYEQAFEAATGQPLLDQIDVAGRTEPEIAVGTLTLHNIPATETTLKKYYSALKQIYATAGPVLRSRGRAYAGAAGALRALAREPGVVQSVLTGNLKEVAFAKLHAFDLDKWIDLEVGGYGSDDAVRWRLVQVARRRAELKYGEGYDGRSTVVIGDTPLDVGAAIRGGASIIGVASGKYSRTDLTGAGAEATLPDLDDLPALMSALEVVGRADSP